MMERAIQLPKLAQQPAARHAWETTPDADSGAPRLDGAGSMRLMTVLGIDLAAGAPKTYACLLEPSDDQLHAPIAAGCGDEDLRQMAQGCAKVASDAPFGWPDPFINAFVAHRAADAWPAPDDEPPEIFRASLSFRTTDRVTMHTRRPLSVSTDRLGVTAMRCAHLLPASPSLTTPPMVPTGRVVPSSASSGTRPVSRSLTSRRGCAGAPVG
jgi:hypothetical protein